MSKQMTPVVLRNIWTRFFTPKRVCHELGVCPAFYRPLDLEEETFRIINLPPLPLIESQNKQEKYKETEKSVIKILQLSDLHLDLEYQQGYSTVCNDIICCHKENGISPSPSQSAGPYGNFNCDSPIILFDDAVARIKTLHPDLDVIVLSGDIPAHNEWSKSMQSNNYITNMAIQKLSSLAPEIIFAFGNNQCFPDHQYDAKREEILKDGMTKTLYKYLTPEESKVLKANGYYSRRLQKLGLKIIAMNSMVCDNMNFYIIANVTDPNNELLWLEQELLHSEASKEKVILVSHIPPSLLECSTIWSEIYRALVARFNDTIVGQFYGHTHQDLLTVNTNPVTLAPTGILFQAPSFTPLGSRYPSFRIYQLDAETRKVSNYYQYSANITAANLDTTGGPADWKLTYNFTGEYGLSSANDKKQIERLQQLIKNNELVGKKYRSHVKAGVNANSLDLKQLYCQTLDSHAEVYKCKNITAQSDQMNYVMEKLQGNWQIKIPHSEKQ